MLHKNILFEQCQIIFILTSIEQLDKTNELLNCQTFLISSDIRSDSSCDY